MKFLYFLTFLLAVSVTNGDLLSGNHRNSKVLMIPKMQSTCVYENSLVTIIETIDRIQFWYQSFDRNSSDSHEQTTPFSVTDIPPPKESDTEKLKRLQSEVGDLMKRKQEKKHRKKASKDNSASTLAPTEDSKKRVQRMVKDEKEEFKELDNALDKFTNSDKPRLPELKRIARSLEDTLKPLKKNIEKNSMDTLIESLPEKASPTWQEEVENCLFQYKMLQKIIEFESDIRPRIEQDMFDHTHPVYFRSAILRFIAILFLFGSIFSLFALWALYMEEAGTSRRFSNANTAALNGQKPCYA